jgi:hypothetical protein
MAMNRIHFQPGLSMPEFAQRFGSESQCAAALGGGAVAERVFLSALR